jgi:hypothetical protein
MKIVAHEDDTGCAPRSCRFYATDADTYDGAPDSRNRATIGYGPTPSAAIADLLELIAAEEDLDADWLREAKESNAV